METDELFPSDIYKIEEFSSFKQRVNLLDNEESIKWHQRYESHDYSWINNDEGALNLIQEYYDRKCKEAHELYCKRKKIKEMFKDIDKEELIKYIKGEF